MNEVAILVTSKDQTSGAFKSATGEAKNFGAGLQSVGDRADASEQRVLGMKDTVDGIATIMQGPGEQGIAAYLQGWADLASGVANFIIPALMSLSKAAIVSAGQHVASAARVVGGWIAMAASAMASAVTMAVAWLISLGPIALVILAIMAIVGVFILLWVKSAAFRDFFIGVWEWIKKVAVAAADDLQRRWQAFIAFFTAIPGNIRRIASGMWDGIVAGFKAAINFLIRGWNALDFSINISIPDWVPGVGGKGFHVGDVIPDIPYLATGGRVTRTGAAVIHAGEQVVPAAQVARGGVGQGSALDVRFSGNVDSAFATAFMRLVREGLITISSTAVV